jgi:hypothetical protein
MCDVSVGELLPMFENHCWNNQDYQQQFYTKIVADTQVSTVVLHKNIAHTQVSTTVLLENRCRYSSIYIGFSTRTTADTRFRHSRNNFREVKHIVHQPSLQEIWPMTLCHKIPFMMLWWWK